MFKSAGSVLSRSIVIVHRASLCHVNKTRAINRPYQNILNTVVDSSLLLLSNYYY